MIVVKHKYIAARGKGGVGKVAGIGKAMAHVKYIQFRPGEDRERGSAGRDMFNDSEDRLNSKDMRAAIRELGDAKVIAHKLTLAPEISPEDKKAFTRDVMKNLSRDKGLDLDWFAVEHNNTDHHHIHVVILGKDRNGTEVSCSGLRSSEPRIEIIRDFWRKLIETISGGWCTLIETGRTLIETDTN